MGIHIYVYIYVYIYVSDPIFCYDVAKDKELWEHMIDEKFMTCYR